MFKYEEVERDFQPLLQSVNLMEVQDSQEIEKYIRAGEYALALDGIACVYLENDVGMSRELGEIFEKLAAYMHLDDDPEYDAVAKLREILASSP